MCVAHVHTPLLMSPSFDMSIGRSKSMSQGSHEPRTNTPMYGGSPLIASGLCKRALIPTCIILLQIIGSSRFRLITKVVIFCYKMIVRIPQCRQLVFGGCDHTFEGCFSANTSCAPSIDFHWCGNGKQLPCPSPSDGIYKQHAAARGAHQSRTLFVFDTKANHVHPNPRGSLATSTPYLQLPFPSSRIRLCDSLRKR